MMPDLIAAEQVFQSASAYMIQAGLLAELTWQRRVSFHEFTETDLLRESAWVVLCSGFREQIVRHVFDHISLCFCDWESAEAIGEADPACRIAALASFGNRSKINAIAGIAFHVRKVGFDRFKKKVLLEPIAQLQRLPYIGPITVFHLAKNLGLDVSKRDRHLTRLASQLGFSNTRHLCTEIARITGEQQNVVDLIIWRYLSDIGHVGRGAIRPLGKVRQPKSVGLRVIEES